MIVKQEILMNEIIALLSENKEVVLRAKGRSMHPYIRDGIDSLVFQRTDPNTLKAGDMILAKTTAGHYVMHRIIRVDDDGFTLKGDGNLFGKEHCKRQEVIGKLAYIEKDGRRIDCNSCSERLKASIMRNTWQTYQKTKYYIKRLINKCVC